MSSDSSDDENLDKLREAADTQFINDSMFNTKSGITNERVSQEKLPSLRNTKDDDEQFNLFRVSPEFRNYVAKQLTAILEKQIKYENNYDAYIKPKKRKGGIKLFHNSSHYIKKLKSELNSPPIRSNRKAISDDEDTKEKFKSVAVSPEDILSQKETQSWSKRSKAPVYTYQATKTGLILK